MVGKSLAYKVWFGNGWQTTALGERSLAMVAKPLPLQAGLRKEATLAMVAKPLRRQANGLGIVGKPCAPTLQTTREGSFGNGWQSPVSMQGGLAIVGKPGPLKRRLTTVDKVVAVRTRGLATIANDIVN